MGFPNDRVKTDRYAIPLVHQADADLPGAKRHLVIITEVGAPAFDIGTPGEEGFIPGMVTVEDIVGELSPAERNSIQSRESLEAQGAFPDNSDLV